ncbi:MAG: trigger factor [Alphaproteobacteria bacterium]|nr:trigger factor [Alphaproteobacteria bacterium]
MQVKETKTEGLKHSFKFVISADEIASKVSEKIKEYGKTANIPGFRPGKVPESMLRKRYENAFFGEVVEEMINEEPFNEFEKKSLRPALRPQINVEKYEHGKDLEFTVDVEVLPEIKPVDFSTISLEKLVAEIPEDDVEKSLKHLSEVFGTKEKVTEDRAAVKGDIAVIDFVGSVDGVEFQGGKGTNYALELGSNSFIPGYEDQVIGHKAGEKFDVKVKFPENYQAKDLAGKDAVFAVEIHELQAKKPAEINDELAKKFGKEKLDDVKEMIRHELGGEYEAVSTGLLKRNLMDALSDAHDFEVPAGLVDMEFDAVWKQVSQAKANKKLDAEDAAKSEDELKDSYRTISERRVRLGLLLADVAEKNKLQVTDADLNRAILMETRQFPGQEKAVMDFYHKNPRMLDQLRSNLFEEKAVDFILKQVKLTEKKVAPEDLYKADADTEKAPAPKKSEKKTTAKKTTKKKTADAE